MKKFIGLAVAIILVLGLTATDAKSGPMVLKALTAFPKNNLGNDPVPIFIDKVNRAAKGRLKIDWLGGPEVIKTFDQIHALKAGTIDMLLYYPFGYLKPLMPEAWAKGLSELTEWEERKTGAHDLWSEIFEKRVNAKYLGRFHSLVEFLVYSNKKIEKVEDFKGLKIRVMPLYIPFMKALGAVPVTLPPPEMYTAMERGVVDALMWPRFAMVSWGLPEVTKYTIEPGVFQVEPATMMNLEKWKKIPNDLQELIMSIMQDMEYIGAVRGMMIAEKEDRVRNEAGMKVLHMPPQEYEKFRKTCYDKTWEFVIKGSPEYGPKLRELSSRKAIPKGTFLWQ